MSDKSTVQDKIQGYVDQLEHLLEQCVADLQSRPDAFLWHCRRCMECISYANETRKKEDFMPGIKSHEDPKKDNVSNNIAHFLPKELQSDWRYIIDKCNLAVHIQGPKKRSVESDAKYCVPLLINLVCWFFEESNVPSCPMPTGIQDCLKKLKNGGVSQQDLSKKLAEREESEKELIERHLQELQSRADEKRNLEAIISCLMADGKKLEDELRNREQELRSQANEKRNLETITSRLMAEGKKLEEDLRKRERELRELHARTAAAVEPPRPLTPTPPPVHGLARESTPPSPRTGSRWLLVGGLLVSSLVLLALQSSRTASRPEVVVPLVPSAPCLNPPEAPSASSPFMVPAVPPSAPPSPPLTCPAGMMQIPGRQFTLRQPARNAWPAGKAVLQAEQVASFCIDQKPVSTTEYRSCVDQHLCDAPKKNEACAWGWDRDLPMACRTQQEAEQFCQKMRQGHLPTVLQFEVAHAIASKELNFHKRTGEWSLEPFPAPVFQRGPVEERCKNKPGRCFMIFAPTISSVPEDDPSAKALDPGWNRDLGTTHRADLAFRCVR